MPASAPASESPAPPAAVAHLAAWLVARLPQLATLLLAGATGLVLLLGVWALCSGVPTVRGVDMNVVLTLQKTLLGLPLYTDPAAPPYDITQYSPAFYLITLAVIRALGLTAVDGPQILVTARLVAVAACAASFALTVAIGRRSFGLGPRKAWGVALFGLVATAPWLFLARPDSLALAVMLAAFGTAIAAARDPRPLPPAFLAALFLAGVSPFIKQNGAVVGIVLVAYFAWVGRYRLAAAAVVGFPAIMAALWALCERVWPFYTENVVGGVKNGISILNAVEKTYSGFFEPFAFLLAGATLALLRWMTARAEPGRQFFVVALPLLLGAATVAGLKAGSAENYYNEWIILAALAIVIWLEERPAASDAPGDARASAWPLAGSTLVAAVLIVWLPFRGLLLVYETWWSRIDPRVSWIYPPNSLWSPDYARLRAVVAAQVPAGRYVLAFPLPANSAIPEWILVPQKEIAEDVYETGGLTYDALRRQLAEGRIALIVTTGDAPPARFLGSRMPAVVEGERIGILRTFKVAPAP
jgi:hypothetical protein